MVTSVKYKGYLGPSKLDRVRLFVDTGTFERQNLVNTTAQKCLSTSLPHIDRSSILIYKRLSELKRQNFSDYPNTHYHFFVALFVRLFIQLQSPYYLALAESLYLDGMNDFSPEVEEDIRQTLFVHVDAYNIPIFTKEELWYELNRIFESEA
jgi:hypothetical protein